MRRVSSVLRQADAWLFAPGQRRWLAVLRAGLAAVLGLRVALWPFTALAGTPSTQFRPPVILSWLDGFPSTGAIAIIQVTGTAAALLAIAAVARDRRASAPMLVAWLSFLVLAGLKTSTGKLLHNDVLLLLATVPVLLCRTPATWRDRTPSAHAGWPVRAAMVTVALVYFLCGVQKMRHSGPDWAFSDNMTWILDSAISSGGAQVESLSRAIASSWLGSRFAAAGLFGLELAFPAVLLWRASRPWFAAAAIAMHSMTWLTLGLDYWSWSLVAGLVLILGYKVDEPRPSLASA